MRVASPPQSIGECNCSICRRLGTLWAYYDPSDVVIEGETAAYAWGDQTMEFRRCNVCGCTTHWVSLDPEENRMAINARMLEDFDLGSVELRKIDGASF
jgi:hypothetical protein